MTDCLESVGKSFPRLEALAKVTGAAKYAPDLKLSGMLHAGLLRSPHAHALVKSIDLSRARELPGVRGIATIEQVPKVVGYWYFLRTEEKKRKMLLLDNQVRFIGDPIAAVAADDEYTVQQALNLIKVEYEHLPPLFDPSKSLAEKNIKIHKQGNLAFKVERAWGDPRQGLANSHLVLSNTYHTSKQKHAPLEPIGTCLAHYEAGGRLTVHSSTQLPHWSQMYLAEVMEMPLNQVRVIKPFTGGAFGGRCGLIHGLETMCCWLARDTKRPVKMSFTRQEDFMATETRHPMTIKLTTGVDKHGLLLAQEIDILADVGAYGTHYIGVLADCLSTGVGLYQIPQVGFSARAVYTNTTPCGAFRGYGNPQLNFAQESQMDALACELGMDPLEFRLKNYRGLGQIDPVFNDEIRSEGLSECLEKGAETFGWSQKRRKTPDQGTVKTGAGMSIMLHGTGAARALPDPASATVMISADGSLTLLTAAADDGQGNRTALAQIACQVLGVEMDKIALSDTDTGAAPLDGGTHGSRQTYCGGMAVKKAAQEARNQLLAFAAKELSAEPGQLDIAKSVIFQKDKPENKIALSQLMRKMQIGDMSVCQQIIASATGIAEAMPGYYGAAFAQVEVDTLTGQVKVLRLTGAYDVGRAINPDFVEGQIIGGGVMGIGWALTEEMIIKSGRVMNNNLADYRLLRSCDVPEMDAIIVESHEPTGPFGAKGVGEGSMVPVASALANAVFNAVGVRVKDLPITPEKILALLDAKRG